MFAALIIVLVGALFGPMLGPRMDQVNDGIDAWESAVKKVVAEKEKKQEALSLIQSVRDELKVRRVQYAEALEQYLKVDAVYSATAEDYEAALSKLNTVWTEQETWLIGRRFDLRDLMTEAEWKESLQLVDAELSDQWDKLKTAQKNLQTNLRKREKKAARHH